MAVHWPCVLDDRDDDAPTWSRLTTKNSPSRARSARGAFSDANWNSAYAIFEHHLLSCVLTERSSTADYGYVGFSSALVIALRRSSRKVNPAPSVLHLWRPICSLPYPASAPPTVSTRPSAKKTGSTNTEGINSLPACRFVHPLARAIGCDPVAGDLIVLRSYWPSSFSCSYLSFRLTALPSSREHQWKSVKPCIAPSASHEFTCAKLRL